MVYSIRTPHDIRVVFLTYFSVYLKDYAYLLSFPRDACLDREKRLPKITR